MKRALPVLGLLVAAVILPRLDLFVGDLQLIWDDHALLVEDARTATLSSIPGYFVEPYFEHYPEVGLYRPMVNATLTVERVVFGDHAVRAHRAVNLLLHLAATLLLWGLLRRWQPHRPIVAVVAAMIFAAHPAATEVIGWIAARGDSGAAVFSLLAIHLWLRRTTGGWIGSMAAFLVALFFKPVAVVVPVVLLLIELRRPREDRELSRVALPVLLYLIPILLVFMLRGGATGSITPRDEGVTLRDTDVLFRSLIAFGLLARNLVALAWPIGLTGDYQPETIWRGGTQALPFSWLLAAIFSLVVIAILVVTWRRSGLGGFGLGWAILFLIPVLQIVPIGAVLADRFLYLPAMGFAIAVAAGLEGLGRRLGDGVVRWPFGLAVGVLFACFSAIGFARAPAYVDDGAFNRHVLARYTGDGWRQKGLGEIHKRLGLHYQRQAARVDDVETRDALRREALRQYETAHRADPQSSDTMRRLGALMTTFADSNEAFLEARTMLMKALGGSPPNEQWKAYYEVSRCLVRAHEWATKHARGVTLVGRNPSAEAEAYLTGRVLKRFPDYVPALRMRGRILIRYLGEPERGKADLLRVVELDPSHAKWVERYLDSAPNVSR